MWLRCDCGSAHVTQQRSLNGRSIVDKVTMDKTGGHNDVAMLIIVRPSIVSSLWHERRNVSLIHSVVWFADQLRPGRDRNWTHTASGQSYVWMCEAINFLVKREPATGTQRSQVASSHSATGPRWHRGDRALRRQRRVNRLAGHWMQRRNSVVVFTHKTRRVHQQGVSPFCMNGIGVTPHSRLNEYAMHDPSCPLTKRLSDGEAWTERHDFNRETSLWPLGTNHEWS